MNITQEQVVAVAKEYGVEGELVMRGVIIPTRYFEFNASQLLQFAQHFTDLADADKDKQIAELEAELKQVEDAEPCAYYHAPTAKVLHKYDVDEYNFYVNPHEYVALIRKPTFKE